MEILMNSNRSDAHLADYLTYLNVECSLSENTIISYRNQLKGYLRFLKTLDKDFTNAKTRDIQGFLEMKMAAGCKPSSRFISAIAIKKFHLYLRNKRICESNPAAEVNLPKFRQQIPEPLPFEDIEKLIDRAIGNRFSLIRMKAMMELLYSTGTRVSELVSLRLDQIDFRGKWIRVNGKGDRHRDVPIGPKACEALESYLEACKGRFGPLKGVVFLNARGGKLTRGGFWKQLKMLGRSAMIPGRVFPHRIRHSTACHLLSNGVDLRVIQELFGHASITTTQRYAHVTPAFLKSKVESSHPRF